MKITLANILVGILLIPNAFGQSLLCQADIPGGFGSRGPVTSGNLIIGIGPGPAHADLFSGLVVGPTDTGRTFTISPSTDPSFNDFVNYLTDGTGEYMGWEWTSLPLVPGGGAGGEYGVRPATFFTSLPPGNNGIDLGGFSIDSMSLHFNNLQFSTVGTLDEVTFDAVFSVYGQQSIPEPGCLSVLLVGALAFWITRYSQRHGAQC